MSDEQIFEKVFKRKPEPVVVEVPMPVYYENSERPLGNLKTKIEGIAGSTAELQIEAEPFAAYIEKLVAPEYYKFMVIKGSELVEAESLKGTGWVPLSAFRSQGYQVHYDEKKLELRIRVPPELRKRQKSSLMGDYSEFLEKPSFEPAGFSTYLNMQGTQDYFLGDDGWGNGRQPFRVLFENGLRLKNFVLESSATFSEARDANTQTWTRHDVRLVHDSPELRLRKTLGDLNYPTMGYQVPLPLGGISVFSHFGLLPSRLSVPTGNFSILLKERSKIKVLNNNQVVRELELPAGPHDLTDLQFRTGGNNVKLEIMGESGQSETRELTYYFASELLQSGLHQISYSIGAPYTQAGTVRYYNTSQPVASLFHRYGLSNSLTLGANFQAAPQKYLAGFESLFSTSFGFFRFEPAIASTIEKGTAHAFRIRYYYLDSLGPSTSQRTFSLGLNSLGETFAPMSDSPVRNTTAHEINVGYGQSISDSSTVTAGFTYQINRPIMQDTTNSFRLSIALSRRWGSDVGTNLMLQQSLNSNGKPESSFGAFLLWNFGKENQSVTASYDVRDDAFRGTWNYTSPGKTAGSTSVRAGIKRSQFQRGFDGQFQYMGNRAIVHVNGGTSWDLKQPVLTPMTTVNAQVGTALVYAGGRFALSRPVSDSFLLVSGEKNFANQVLQLNPRRDDTYLAATDWMGPAVIPDLSSHNFSTVKLGIKDPRPGSFLENDRVVLYPRYKSGYTLILGTDAAISMSLRLVSADDSPLPLKPGKVSSLDDSAFEDVSFFTSRSGKSRIDGLKPGRYQLRLLDDEWDPITVEIPENEGLFDIGKIVMKRRTP